MSKNFWTAHQHQYNPVLPVRQPPQRLLVGLFDTCQPAISRAINTILDALDQVLTEPPEPADVDLRFSGIINDTLVPYYLWADRPELYNEKTQDHRI